MCAKIIKTFLPVQKFLSFSLTDHGLMDGRTDSQVDYRAHSEISLEYGWSNFVGVGGGRHPIREANDIFKEH